MDELALVIVLVPVRMLLDPRVVECGVVRHPVEDDIQTQAVCFVDHGLELLDRTELGIETPVVLHRIGAAQFARSVRVTDRVNRHDPYDADTKLF